MTPKTDSVAVLRELLDKARKLATAITRAQYEDTGRLSMELVFDLEAAIAHPAPPGSDAVTEEMVAAALDAQPFKHVNSSTRVWQLIASDADGQATVMRIALTDALAARTGKGETL